MGRKISSVRKIWALGGTGHYGMPFSVSRLLYMLYASTVLRMQVGCARRLLLSAATTASLRFTAGSRGQI
jgi:hypothetical protein